MAEGAVESRFPGQESVEEEASERVEEGANELEAPETSITSSKQRRRSSRRRSTAGSESEGPDTSSLSAFLLSLLTYDAAPPIRDDDDGPTISSSSSDGSYFTDDELDEAKAPAFDQENQDELEEKRYEDRSSFDPPESSFPGDPEEVQTDMGASSVRSLSEGARLGIGVDEQAPIEASPSKVPGGSDFEGASGGEESSTVGSPASPVTSPAESDWQLVSATSPVEDARTPRSRAGFWKPTTTPGRIKTIAQLVDPKLAVAAATESQLVTKSPRGSFTGSPRGLKLPQLSEPSLMLTDKMRTLLCSALPALVLGRPWVLLYSTEKHGISLNTLYRNSAQLPGPTVLVMSDRQGAVFGGFTSHPLEPSNRRKYQGTNDCFVFLDHGDEPKLCRSTGANRYFVLCMNDSLSFGGGGHFAFRIDTELLHGSSGPCDTFGSPCLAKTEDFDIHYVELWGFTRPGQRLSRSDTIGISNSKPDAGVGETS